MFSLQTSLFWAGRKIQPWRRHLRENVRIFTDIVGHVCLSCCVSDVWWERESSVSSLPGELVCPQLLILVKVEQQILRHLGHKVPSWSLVVPQYNLIKTLPKKRRKKKRQALTFRGLVGCLDGRPKFVVNPTMAAHFDLFCFDVNVFTKGLTFVV